MKEMINMLNKIKQPSWNDMQFVSAVKEIRDSLQAKNLIAIYKELHENQMISDDEYKDILSRIAAAEWVHI
jgi:hypothetical protein